jgi:hypothetical protein
MQSCPPTGASRTFARRSVRADRFPELQSKLCCYLSIELPPLLWRAPDVLLIHLAADAPYFREGRSILRIMVSADIHAER